MESYKVYYRDYKNSEVYLIGVLPERRKDPKRDRPFLSIVRWAKILFKEIVPDINGIFVFKKPFHSGTNKPY